MTDWYEEDYEDERIAQRQLARAKRRRAKLQEMEHNNPDFDCDEFDALDGFINEEEGDTHD